MTTPLSHTLRTATAQAHERAEHSSFVDDLLEGRSCKAAFTALAVQQHVIYDALESVIQEHYREDPLVKVVDDRRLDRRAALSADLDHLLGSDHTQRLAAGQLPVLPATTRYADRLRLEHDSELVLAHHYVRYLGDLSGGQVIARLVARHYAIPREALGFYSFEGIEKLKPYKDDYRARLDSLDLPPQRRELLVERAVEAFDLSRAVFADLDAARGPQHVAAGIAA